jgi:hypothetical protein
MYFVLPKKVSFSSRISFIVLSFVKLFMNFFNFLFYFIESSNQTRVLHWKCNSDVRDVDVCDGFIVPANHERVGFLCS